jgi:Zn-dependent M28 family amino/carboxypeptidase
MKFFAALALGVIAAGALAQRPVQLFGPVNEIKGSDAKAHLEFFASDALEGRFTPSRGLDIAALYIAAQLKLWGAQPGGGKGSYYQKFQVPAPGGGTAETQNVIGIFPGSDPKLRAEHVIIGCHYDHIGMADTGADRVFNGADDNGSGIVALLEMAHALSVGPRPARTIVLIWHAGEERGLWGAHHFVENPTIPLSSVTAMLNLDMIGRSWTPAMGERFRKQVTGPEEIFVIGARKISTELGDLSDKVNREYLGLAYNTNYDDPKDTERLFYRSDHYEYARKGIPIIFWFDGLHPDYHQVTDEISTIDFAKLEKVAKTIFATAWRLATVPGKMKVDRPLDASGQR